MLTPHLEEQLWDLIYSYDPKIQQHGLELVRGLEPADREVVVRELLDSDWPRRWLMAACCLLDRPEALRRSRLFAARVALRRLEQRRAAGQEPDERAWRFQEAAEALAAGRPEDAELEDMRMQCEDYARSWHGDDDFGPGNPARNWLINDAIFRFEAVPDDAEPEDRELLGIRDRDLLLIDPWDLDIDDDLDRDWAALHGAACAMMPWVWGMNQDDPDPISRPRTIPEGRWQQAAWHAIFWENRDPIEMVWQSLRLP